MYCFLMSLTFFVILCRHAFFRVSFPKIAYYHGKNRFFPSPVHWCWKGGKRDHEERAAMRSVSLSWYKMAFTEVKNARVGEKTNKNFVKTKANDIANHYCQRIVLRLALPAVRSHTNATLFLSPFDAKQEVTTTAEHDKQ